MAQVTSICVKAGLSATIDASMIRKAILAEMKRRGMNTYQLALASGVTYSRLFEWLTGKLKPTGDPCSLTTEKLEAVMAVLGLRICRGKVSKPQRRRPSPK